MNMLSKKKGAAQQRGTSYEKAKAKAHGAKRVGGPSNPDAVTRGGGKIEMKDWSNPVPKPVVVKAKQKGVSKFIAKSGFTGPAIEYGKKRGMKLYEGKKKLT